MGRKIYNTDDDYILDVLEDEEERILDELAEALSDESRYLFYRYLSVKDRIEKIKSKIA